MGLITGCSPTLVSSAVLFFPNGWLGLTRSMGKYSWMARNSSKASLILSSRPILKRPGFLWSIHVLDWRVCFFLAYV